MSEVSAVDIRAGQIPEQTLVFEKGIVFLPEGIPVDPDDKDLLNFWKIPTLRIQDDFSFDTSGCERWPEDRLVYVKELSDLHELLTKFYNEVKSRGNGTFGPIRQKFDDIFSMIKQNKFLILFIINNKIFNQGGHAQSALETMIYSMVIGMHLGLDEEKQKTLYASSLLVNISMLRIDDVVSGAAKLSPQDMAKVMAHPIQSYHLIKGKFGVPEIVALIALTHHENIDGSGYPKKLMKDKIPLYAQIIAVTQEFSALRQNRPHRKAFSLYDAMRTLLGEGRKKFNQTILTCFLANQSLYPIGTILHMSNDTVAVVVGANPTVSMRPNIKPFLDASRKKIENGEVIVLADDKKLVIKKVINDENLQKNILDYF